MGLRQTTAPMIEPVGLQELRAQTRVLHDADDGYLIALSKAARAYVEQITGRQLVQATFQLKQDGFPECDDPLILPKPPLRSVSSITYVDTAGATQTMPSSDYVVSLSDERPGRVRLAYGKSWPSIRCQPDAVTVTFVAGYSTSSSVATKIPDNAKHAIKMTAAHWYEHREDVSEGVTMSQVPRAVDALLDSMSYGGL